MITKISKGLQITIPGELRKLLNLKAGSNIEIEESKGNIIIKPLKEDLENLFKEAKNKNPKHHLTAKKMDKIIEYEIYR